MAARRIPDPKVGGSNPSSLTFGCDPPERSHVILCITEIARPIVPVAKWIRRRFPEPKIEGSSPFRDAFFPSQARLV